MLNFFIFQIAVNFKYTGEQRYQELDLSWSKVWDELDLSLTGTGMGAYFVALAGVVEYR